MGKNTDRAIRVHNNNSKPEGFKCSSVLEWINILWYILKT
jgi:hypothetical protein